MPRRSPLAPPSNAVASQRSSNGVTAAAAEQPSASTAPQAAAGDDAGVGKGCEGRPSSSSARRDHSRQRTSSWRRSFLRSFLRRRSSSSLSLSSWRPMARRAHRVAASGRHFRRRHADGGESTGHRSGKTMNREKSKGMHGSRGAMQVRHFPRRSERQSFAPCWCLAGANHSRESASRVARTGAPTTPPRPARSRRARVTHALATLNPLL